MVKIKTKLINFFRPYCGMLLALMASGVISLSLNWHLIKELGRIKFGLSGLCYWLVIFLSYRLIKILYLFLVKRLPIHHYWQSEFYKFLDTLFLIGSLFFILSFSHNELLNIFLFIALALFLWERLNYFFSSHPNAQGWQSVNQIIFLLSGFIFISSVIFQFYAYHNYILEIKYGDHPLKFTIILRALAITLAWLGCFSVSALLHSLFKRKIKYFFLGLWLGLFVASLFIAALNIGLLRFSGLYLNPAMLAYVKGSGELFKNKFLIYLLAGLALLFYVFYLILLDIKKLSKNAPKKYWYFYNVSIIILASSFLIITPFLKNTPEYFMAKNFYQYYFGSKSNQTIDYGILKKMEKFGLKFDFDNNFLARRDKIYKATDKNFLPEKFSQTKPNIIIVFLESFSSRLTGVYNKDLTGLTPGLEAMANDENTTVFKKFYNTSTPTITGIISQLCSFAPPTGHDGITKQNTAVRYNMPCLPAILKKYGNYQNISYVTAVDKNYSNKGNIIADLNVDEILGTAELSQLIVGRPLSWGYSDHQIFPLILKLAKSKTQPWLMMYSTVDVHPPFNLAKDAIVYEQGQSDLLNSIHTTDDAFLKFWHDFKTSPLADNTILITVADHAIFPAVYKNITDKKLVKNVSGEITFYDEIVFMLYLPQTTLPREISLYSSGIDLTPTLLQILNINIPNFFEGLSILDERQNFPNLLGSNEYELYINQELSDKTRDIQSGSPDKTKGVKRNSADNYPDDRLTLDEYLQYYQWKKSLFNNN